MIELKGLTKYYGKTRGVESLDLTVNKGEVFGFLGPNGAGKTTTIRLLLDLIRPTAGKAFINGLDCQTQTEQVKEVIEYLPTNFSAYKQLSCAEYLKFTSGFYNKDTWQKGKELAEYFQLDLSRKVGQSSQGMKQKLGLIQVFMVDCPLYILDEPTSGLDPLVQQKFYQLVKERRDEGKTIFLSSHILSEVERICDRVGIIRDGKLIEVDYVKNLKHKKYKEVRVTYAEKPPEDFLNREGLKVISREGEDNLTVILRINSDLGENLQHLAEVELLDINVTNPSLEEVFLSYYGRNDEDENS